MGRAPFSVIGLLLFACLATSPSRGDELRDLYFGEALYYAHQGYFFEALERLDSELKQHGELDEPELDTFYLHINDAEFSLGDFELRYRMHHRAGRAIRAVLEGAVDEIIRNDAAYYLAQARPAESIPVLKRLQSSDSFGGFAAYNLGIAYLQDGQRQAALSQLDQAGQIVTGDAAELAIRDKSNLVLGTILLEDGDYDQAAPFLNRVRLDGPFSNQALLSAGWANMSSDNFERAVVPWSILADREVTDGATQEAMLALPYAYGKLNVHGRAAIFYGRALDSFGVEVDKLNASIESIRDGKFLAALIREEIRKDKDWVIRLRSLPETPETYYLMELLATHDFQTGLQNYLDLADIRRKLLVWQASFDSFDDMVEIRHDHYEPLLPDVDRQFRELDSRMRLRIEQHKMLVKRRDDLLTTPRPEFLATREEQAILTRIEHIENQLKGAETPVEASLQRRIRRLKGTLTWTLHTEYHERLTKFDANLRGLDQAMAVVQKQYNQYVRSRQAATHSYVGYETPISRLRASVRDSVERVDLLMARQGHLLEVVAIRELVARRDRLENYRDKARFALADSYDRATQAQARRREP
jgi:tetratricopeptide (TPR) repeat protein